MTCQSNSPETSLTSFWVVCLTKAASSIENAYLKALHIIMKSFSVISVWRLWNRSVIQCQNSSVLAPLMEIKLARMAMSLLSKSLILLPSTKSFWIMLQTLCSSSGSKTCLTLGLTSIPTRLLMSFAFRFSLYSLSRKNCVRHYTSSAFISTDESVFARILQILANANLSLIQFEALATISSCILCQN